MQRKQVLRAIFATSTKLFAKLNTIVYVKTSPIGFKRFSARFISNEREQFAKSKNKPNLWFENTASSNYYKHCRCHRLNIYIFYLSLFWMPEKIENVKAYTITLLRITYHWEFFRQQQCIDIGLSIGCLNWTACVITCICIHATHWQITIIGNWKHLTMCGGWVPFYRSRRIRLILFILSIHPSIRPVRPYIPYRSINAFVRFMFVRLPVYPSVHPLNRPFIKPHANIWKFNLVYEQKLQWAS